MDMISPIVMGILLGGLYALIAMGLSMVFGVMRMINLAHGDLVILGSYLSFALLANFGLDPIVSLVITVPLLSGLGFFIQRFLLRRAADISDEAPLIIAFGIALILQNAIQIVTDPQSRGISTAYSMASFSVGPFQFPVIYLMNFVAALVVMALFSIFLKKTYLGRAIAAASQNKKAAQLMGINTKNIHSAAFAIAMISAAIAGAFLDDIPVPTNIGYSIFDNCFRCGDHRRSGQPVRDLSGGGDTWSGADPVRIFFRIRRPDAFRLFSHFSGAYRET